MTPGRRPSPLRAARSAVGLVWCAVLASFALSLEHPLLLAAALATVAAAAAAAGAARPVLRALAWGFPVALLWMAMNALVHREGATVVFRGGEVPLLGRLDVTAEAVAYGGVLGLRALVVIGCFALYAAAVDPDDLLRSLRRISVRSALTASLATRMVPVLARDGRRMLDAQRCRAGAPAPRLAVVQAVAVGALDRALDVAATLELRGYGAACPPGAAGRRPWSRHDLAFAASSAALAALAAATLVAGWDPFEAYPRTSAPVTAPLAALAAALAGLALAPFASRAGTA